MNLLKYRLTREVFPSYANYIDTPLLHLFFSFTFLHKLNHTYTLTVFYVLTDLNIDYICVEGRDSVYHCIPQA